MKYHAYELANAMIAPWRMGARYLKNQLDYPMNPFGWMPSNRKIVAGCEIFERVTRRYEKPQFGIDSVDIDGAAVAVVAETVLEKPFCNLLRFKREEDAAGARRDPKVLLIAPMSGHFATLLRGTARAMIPGHDLYITDWADAGTVPLEDGRFDLDDFIDYIIDFIQFLGPDVYVIAVCQPAVPALAATARMAAMRTPFKPASLTLMGGPIDTRRNPTVVNELAQNKSLAWFERSVISRVPFPNAGYARRVYPGFVQLSGFMTMELDRHITAHRKLFEHLVEGDEDPVEQHDKFYDEYMSVMDLPAEFYLQTIETVFQKHALPDGLMRHREAPVDCALITDTAIMTVEGEKDDICGLGQTQAAHDLCPNVPAADHRHYEQEGVGHYGVFNGKRWRTDIQPRIAAFIKDVEARR